MELHIFQSSSQPTSYIDSVLVVNHASRWGIRESIQESTRHHFQADNRAVIKWMICESTKFLVNSPLPYLPVGLPARKSPANYSVNQAAEMQPDG